jgi:hypothetical protein
MSDILILASSSLRQDDHSTGAAASRHILSRKILGAPT